MREGRHCLFVSFKDNNAGKELSAVSILIGYAHHGGFSCLSSEQHEYPKEGQSPGGPCCGYFFITFQEGRPTGSYEGWEVV